MANVRINDLTADATPSASDVVAIDGATTRKATLTNAVSAGLAAPLSSIEGLATSADQMLYLTGADVYATTALTPFARTLLDDADAATMRSTLGAVIGTDVQAWDADLDTLAANGLGTTGLALLADETPADARDTIDAVVRVANRTALKALDTTKDVVAIIYDEGGRNGRFIFDDSDLSTEVTADTQEGIYIAPDSDATGASGAWVRQGLDAYEPEFFGASTDSSVDSATALTGLVSLHAVNPLPIRLSALYRSSSTLTFTSTSVDIYGLGAENSGLLFAAVNGIAVDNSGLTEIRLPIRIADCSIRPTSEGVHTGISITGPSGAHYDNQLVIERADMVGVPPDGGYWTVDIDLISAGQTSIKKNNLGGRSPNVRTTSAVQLTGSNIVNVIGNTISHVDYGVRSLGGGSLVVQHNNIIGSLNGVSKSGDENWIDVSHNHMAVSARGVILEAAGTASNHCHVESNFILLFDGTGDHATGDFVGIDIGSNSNTVVNNEVLRTTSTKTRYGCVVRGTRPASDNTIRGNRWNAMDNGVVVEASATNTYVLWNTVVGLARADVLDDSGTNTRHIACDSSGMFGSFGGYDFDTTSGGGVHIQSDSDLGVGTSSPNRRLHVEQDLASPSTVSYLARLTKTLSVTPQNGVGVGMEFEAETSAGNNEVGATIEAVATDVTATSEDFDLVMKLMVAGAAVAEKFRFKGTGQFDLATGGVIRVNSVQVLQARETGWTASTGTANIGAYATYSAPDIDATYNEAQIQALADAVEDNAQRIKALEDALFAHGLIGT